MVGSEGGEYISEKDGYSFIVPRGVLDSDVTITHGIVPFEEVSQYEFPEKIIPVSSIVSICPDLAVGHHSGLLQLWRCTHFLWFYHMQVQ